MNHAVLSVTGFGWKLSDEALAEIIEMERANARAVAELLARGFLIGAPK